MSTVNSVDNNLCVICIEPNKKFYWKCKECNTKYHKACIIKWKKVNPYYPDYYTCPVCKKIYNVSLCNYILDNALKEILLISVFMLIVSIFVIIYPICIFFIIYFLISK